MKALTTGEFVDIRELIQKQGLKLRDTNRTIAIMSKHERKGSTRRSRESRRIDKNLRSIVWHKYARGRMTGKCYVCKRPITYDNFEVGHNKAKATGGRNNINNLRAICKACNRSMGTMAIEVYKARYFGTKRKTKQKRKSRRNSNYEWRTNIYGERYRARKGSIF